MSVSASDHPDLALPPCTPAILIPLSVSAVRSSKLPQNKERLATFSSTPLLGRLTSNSVELKEKRGLKTASIKLRPTVETSQYALGSDTTGYIFLQTSGEDECWVHLQHCRIIPDPDEDCVVLHNTSTSMFTAQDPEKPQENSTILPTRHRVLHCGYWRLNLGAGLEFLLLVFRRPSRCLTGALVLPEKSTPHRQEGEKKKNDQRSRKPPSVNDKRKTLPSEDEELSRTIATTRLTKVVKVVRDGRVTALKICRKPEVIEAADMWKNEKDILSRLKHVCVVQVLLSVWIFSCFAAFNRSAFGL